MTLIGLQTTIMVLAFGTGVQEAQAEMVAFSQRDIQAKIVYCKTCHGLSGEGFRGRSVIPRLAGQQVNYFEDQMRAFIEQRRKDKFMFDVAKVLNPTVVSALATHFRDLNPPPVRGAPTELVAAGKELYEQGVPSADIQPCSSCHGLKAEGQGTVPRLAGQLADYTFKTLMNWSKEQGQDRARQYSSAIMEPIARNLTQAQISALAAYLSDLGTSPSLNNEAVDEVESLKTRPSPQQP